MKLEKREITLNEKDSLADAYLTQKSLLLTYVAALDKVSKKQTRERLLDLMRETCEDLFFVKDLKERIKE